MADFLTDYSNLAGAGAAFQGFAQGLQNAQDQKLKRQEMQAKMDAMKSEQDRNATLTALQARGQGLQIGGAGPTDLQPAPLTPKEQQDANLKMFGEGAKRKIGPDGQPTNDFEINPETPAVIKAKNPGIMGPAKISSKEKLQAENTYNKDPLLNAFVPRLEGAQKILNLIHAAKNGDVKSNQAVLGQLNAEISRLETGSQSPGLGMAEKTEVNDKLAEFQNIRDTWTGKITNVDLGDKFDASESLVRDLGKSINDSVARRSQFLSAGATDAQKEVYAAKAGVLNSQYGGRFDPLEKKTKTNGLVQQEPGFLGRAAGMLGFGSPAQAASAPQIDPATAAKIQRLKELDAKAGK